MGGAFANGEFRELWRRPLEGGRSVVIERSKPRPTATLAGLVPAASLYGYVSVLTVRVGVAEPGGRVTAIAAQIIRTAQASNFEVLDASTAHNQVTIVAAQDGMIAVWRVRAVDPRPVEITTLLPNSWTEFAAAAPLDNSVVAAHLTWNAAGNLEVSVEDKRPSFKRKTEFVCRPDVWRFEPKSKGHQQ